MGYGEFVFSEQKGGLACCWSIKNPEVIKPTKMILKYRYSYYFFLETKPNFKSWSLVGDFTIVRLDTSVRFSILGTSGRYLIVDFEKYGRFLILDTSGQFFYFGP